MTKLAEESAQDYMVRIRAMRRKGSLHRPRYKTLVQAVREAFALALLRDLEYSSVDHLKKRLAKKIERLLARCAAYEAQQKEREKR